MMLKPAFRRFLKRPLGRLLSPREAVKLSRSNSGALTATVGDVTTLLFLSHSPAPAVCVVDFQVQRKPLAKGKIAKLRLAKAVKFKCSNPAGSITPAAAKTVALAVFAALNGKRTVVFVDGEEDLLLLPLLLAVPEGSLIFYGQPNAGVVAVKATKAKKKRVRELLRTCFE